MSIPCQYFATTAEIIIFVSQLLVPLYGLRNSIISMGICSHHTYLTVEFVVQSDMTVGVVEQTPKPHFSFDLQFQSCLFFFMSLGFTYHLDDKLDTNWPNEKVGLG